MSSQNRLLCDREGPLAILTMNEPERMNVFSPALRDLLIANLELLNEDASCRAIVLTGQGAHFSSGGDLSGFTETTPLAARERLEKGGSRLVRLLIAGRKPIVAAVEGNCYGAGLSLAAACDFAVAASNARFCCAFMRVGFIPDLGTLWTLPRRVGLGKAKELTALATEFDGTEAGRIRLVDEVVPPGGALAAAKVVATRFAAASLPAMAFLKLAFSEGLEAALRTEMELNPILAMTDEHAAAKKAFLDRRASKLKIP